MTAAIFVNAIGKWPWRTILAVGNHSHALLSASLEGEGTVKEGGAKMTISGEERGNGCKNGAKITTTNVML